MIGFTTVLVLFVLGIIGLTAEWLWKPTTRSHLRVIRHFWTTYFGSIGFAWKRWFSAWREIVAVHPWAFHVHGEFIAHIARVPFKSWRALTIGKTEAPGFGGEYNLNEALDALRAQKGCPPAEILEAYRTGRLDEIGGPEARRLMWIHLSECETCRQAVK